MVDAVAATLTRDGKTNAYAYHPFLDTFGHLRGVSSEEWREHLLRVDEAAQAIDWTRNQLNDQTGTKEDNHKMWNYLGDLPDIREEDGVTYLHGDELVGWLRSRSSVNVAPSEPARVPPLRRAS